MKKSLTIFLLAILLLSLVIAQNGDDTKPNINDTLKNLSDALKNNVTDFNLGGDDSFLDSEVGSSNGFVNFIKVVFNIGEGKTWKYFIIYLCLWVVLWIMISETVSFIPFFQGKAISFIAGIIITLLASMGGAIHFPTLYLIDLTLLSKFLETKSFTAIALIVIFLALILWGFGKLTKKLKHESVIEKIRRKGEEGRILSEAEQQKLKDLEKNLTKK
ncbi:MAG: hypothetical protein ABIF88_01990 [archaeon]